MLVKTSSGKADVLEVEGYKIGKEYFATKLSDGWSFIDIASGLTIAKSLSTWRACRDYFKSMSDADISKLSSIRNTARYEKAKSLISTYASKSKS